ncbi:hypothetical protein ACQKNB_23665 [Lysinibacillus xylanilyticus]|uniref:hypothetical protein n=1 Tax=Lysinibacillus xylanilyticus TaxID=582475 RepID=UPI003D086592
MEQGWQQALLVLFYFRKNKAGSLLKVVDDIFIYALYIVDWSGGWATPWGSANRGTKAKTVTSCDNAFVTNIVLAQAAQRTPLGSFALCESVVLT